jgi:hypothetical protein
MQSLVLMYFHVIWLSPEGLHNRSHVFPIIMLRLCDHLYCINKELWRSRPWHKMKLRSVNQVSDEFAYSKILHPCSISDRSGWTNISSSVWTYSRCWVGHIPELYSGGPVFKSWSVDQISWQICRFPRYVQANVRIVLHIRPRPLPCKHFSSSLFTNQLISRRHIIWDIASGNKPKQVKLSQCLIC